MKALALMLGALALAAGRAHAGDDPPPETTAPATPSAASTSEASTAQPAASHGATTSVRDPRPGVVPTFTLNGTSTGEATLRLGVNWLIPLTTDHELHVRVNVEAASHDGLSTLLSVSSSGFDTESSAGLSVDATYTTLQAKRRLRRQDLDAMPLAERAAQLRRCETDSSWRRPRFTAKDGTLHDVNPDDLAQVEEVDPGEYCDKAKVTLSAAERYPMPARQLAMSFGVGRSTFTQLTPSDASMAFHPTTVHKPRFSMTLGYAAYQPDAGLSAEAAGELTSVFTAASQKARWCTPTGAVTRPDGSTTDPAETCRELPIGGPTRVTTATASVHLGLVSPDYAWRAAAGPIATLGFGGDAVSYKIGFESPFYLVRSSPEFQGIVKVTPAVLLTRDATGVEDSQVLLTVSLIGGRTLFDTAFR